MVVAANPFCPISLGFLGFLGGIISRRTTLFKHGRGLVDKIVVGEDEEREDLLDQDDVDCDELSEDRIANFLESQKEEYYKSLGMAAPKQMKVLETSSSTTPGESTIEFSSSRETSYLDEGEDSALLVRDAGPSREPSPIPRVYSMTEQDEPQKEPFEKVALE